MDKGDLNPLTVVTIKRRMPQSRSRSISYDYALLNGGNYRRDVESRSGTRTSLPRMSRPGTRGGPFHRARDNARRDNAGEFLARREEEPVGKSVSPALSVVSLLFVFTLARGLLGRLSSDAVNAI